jgi:hypothetical protein
VLVVTGTLACVPLRAVAQRVGSPGMKRQRSIGLYHEVAVRAMEDALYGRLIDRCWSELKGVFEDPEIIEAEAKIMRAIANAFAPNSKPKNSRARRKK